MRKSVLVLIAVLVLFSIAGLSAQTTVGQTKSSQAVTQDPASREDLQKATAEMKKVVRDAERKSAKETALAREAAEKQHEQLLKQTADAEKKLQSKLAEASAAQQKQVEEEQGRMRKMMIYGVAIVSMLVIVGFSFSVLFARSNTKSVEVMVPETHKETSEEILVDPDIPTLKQFSLSHGNIKRVMFRLTLPNRGTALDGAQIMCTAELREDLPPLVYFDGEKDGVAWDKRKQRAATVAAPQGSGWPPSTSFRRNSGDTPV